MTSIISPSRSLASLCEQPLAGDLIHVITPGEVIPVPAWVLDRLPAQGWYLVRRALPLIDVHWLLTGARGPMKLFERFQNHPAKAP
ncbi:hypothetical protein [Bradyrhizobium sp. BWA-3-5]|uniref:hypothetical protein n=1 Tax=Bradyrhizobium sp. BWA-3-5 TaxID=3080013 RepID=UPI00293F4C79|nr:hypothetical protein [Bradyrhizobium sp. BWA-3-5]WOH63966.1 hypothetical protein RX331_25425 [Bradyrhizobium sp. BWA-3-5]